VKPTRDESSEPGPQQDRHGTHAPRRGRKPLIERDPGLAKALDALIGPSKKAALRWTTKSTRDLAQELRRSKHAVGDRTVVALLHEAGYELRSKGGTPGAEVPANAETLFEHLHAGVLRFHRRGDPVIVVEVCRRRSDGALKPAGDNKLPGPGVDAPVLRSLDPALGRLLGKAVANRFVKLTWRGANFHHQPPPFAGARVRGWWRNMGKKWFGKH
jgi:hypothetical protein